jgi:glycosyltransferase involved in cell wall biosynthesis
MRDGLLRTRSETASVTFIIPVRNDANGLRRCLSSIRQQRPDAQILVADNGSIDGSPEVARAFGSLVLSLPNETVAVLRNRAAARATGEYLAFIDADIELADGWLNTALSSLADATVGAVGAEYCAPPNANWLQSLYDAMREHLPGLRDARWLPSGNMVVRRDAFRQVGGFEEGLRTCEDVAFCNALKTHGFRVLTDSRLKSAHYGDPSTLRLLFRGESWRARDNLRVSLRGISSWKDIPSIVIPIVWLSAAVIVVFGGLAAPWWPEMRWVASLGAVCLLCLSVPRAFRIWLRVPDRQRRVFPHACAVAVVYDSARAFALLVSVPHRRATVPAARSGDPV